MTRIFQLFLFCCFLSSYLLLTYERIDDDDCSVCFLVLYYKLDKYKTMSLSLFILDEYNAYDVALSKLEWLD